MKKKFLVLLVLVSIFTLVGCSCSKKETNEEEENIKLTIGDTFEYDDFEITVLNYSLRNAINQNEKHQNLIFMELNVKNNDSKSQKLSQSSFIAYGPNDTKLDRITSSKYESLLYNMDAIRSEGTANGHIAFPFDGYGEYKVEFGSGKKKKVVYFTIYEN